MPTYEEKKQRLITDMQAAGDMTSVRLSKNTSNLFRRRSEGNVKKLNVKDFHGVIQINVEEKWVEVEGMTPYSELVDALLPHGFMPAVVPQLKSITIGGAVSGIGIEATSFRHGLVHESILEMEVLLPGGRVVLCTPTNEHKDLFFGLPNSYGTLGYILKLKAKIIPVKKFVKVSHRSFSDPKTYFEELAKACASSADFVDGVVFSPNEMYFSTAIFTDDAPFVSDYTFRNIYYKSIQEKQTDYLTAYDYIWRWDTDWFWVSKNLGMHHPLLRTLMGKKRLNSVTYTKIMRWNGRWKITDKLNALRGIHTEAVIQDIAIPIDQCVRFFEFYFQEINIRPLWICPAKQADPHALYPLFSLKHDTLYIDFGFWDIKRGKEKLPRGFYNRKIETTCRALGGIKSLYSEAFFPKEEFWSVYNKEAYDALKLRYDPTHKLRDLYAKCVLSQ